jgi:phosphoribosylaminoimidazole-succinocarboxamide synthase
MTQQITPITTLDLPKLKQVNKGKVRHVYDLGKYYLMVTTDRISAFDVVFSKGIPHKGRVLTAISEFWFNFLGAGHHLVSTNVDEFPKVTHQYRDQLEGRSMLVKKSKVLPVECVVRGYIVGSGWKEYQQSGTVCGIPLPEGLQLADKLEEPIFTPAYKAPQGEHDENITFKQMEDMIGKELASYLRDKSLEIYKAGRNYADKKGIILADTKFEFGVSDGDIILIDEVLTPDSSRYWLKSDYHPGVSPPSFDKQIIRDYLETLDWDKTEPGPELPEEIIHKASQKYLEIEEILTKG